MLVNNVASSRRWATCRSSATSSGGGRSPSTSTALFYVTKAASTTSRGGAIINTGSINGLRGNKTLIDYSATKGAVIALTYSLAQALAERGIRVNCVAPGRLDAADTGDDGRGKRVVRANTPVGRAAQPDEIAPSYVFFAAGRLSSFYSGEVLAPLGGVTLPG